MADAVLVFEGLDGGMAVMRPRVPAAALAVPPVGGSGMLLAIGAIAAAIGVGVYVARRGKTVTFAHLPGCPRCAEVKPKIRRAQKALERAGYKVRFADVTLERLSDLPEFETVPAIAVGRGRKARMLYGRALDDFGKITTEKLLDFAKGRRK